MEHNFTLVYQNPHSGGKIVRHELVNVEADDYNDVYEIAVDSADLGGFVEMLPALEANDSLRTVLFEGAKENKCPDLRVDGEYVEIKTPTLPLKERKISGAIRNAHAQAHYVVIRLTSKYPEQFLRKVAKGRFDTHATLERIEFKCCVNGAYHCFKRSDFK